MYAFKNILLISAALSVTSCAYFIEDSIQDVKFLTPGAHNAECDVFVDGFRFRVNPPQTINLPNGYQDLVVDCKAPGNRRKKVFIKPHLAETSPLNIGTAGIGYVWDHASGALYKYPAVIEVNFTDTPITDSALPAQNNPDIRQPEDYPLEEYVPTKPTMNKDKYKEEAELLRRAGSYANERSINEDSFFEPAGDISGKGGGYNASSSPAGAAPTPLIPGE